MNRLTPTYLLNLLRSILGFVKFGRFIVHLLWHVLKLNHEDTMCAQEPT